MTKRSHLSLVNKKLKALVFSNFPWMLHHNACGKLALYIRFLPTPGDILENTDTIYPDGSVPAAGEVPTCFSCKKQLTHTDFDMDNFKRIQ